MKLYTEEQVMDIITKAFLSEYPTISNDILNEFTPIELPSDEEIESRLANKAGIHYALQAHGFIIGAKWIKDKILNK